MSVNEMLVPNETYIQTEVPTWRSISRVTSSGLARSARKRTPRPVSVHLQAALSVEGDIL